MRNHWYIACNGATLGAKPLARRILGEPIVLFRGADGRAAALGDRCPHRNVQLSGGKVCAGRIQCPYHGWEFEPSGACAHIPSLCPGEGIPSQAVAKPYPVCEQDDYVWVWVGDEAPGDRKPFQLPHRNEPGWANARLESDVIPNSVDNVVENFIDCPHTGYVHGGLFRTPASHMARTKVQAVPDGVVIDIDEDQEGESLLARLLLRKGEKVSHRDRFILPSIVQVYYGFGAEKAITGFQICTPEAEFQTRVYVYLTWKMGVLTHLMTPFMPTIGKVVLNQDMGVLINQGEVIQQQGKRFTSAPADTANLWIQAARERALRGDAPAPDREKQVDFRL